MRSRPRRQPTYSATRQRLTAKAAAALERLPRKASSSWRMCWSRRCCRRRHLQVLLLPAHSALHAANTALHCHLVHVHAAPALPALLPRRHLPPLGGVNQYATSGDLIEATHALQVRRLCAWAPPRPPAGGCCGGLRATPPRSWASRASSAGGESALRPGSAQSLSLCRPHLIQLLAESCGRAAAAALSLQV